MVERGASKCAATFLSSAQVNEVLCSLGLSVGVKLENEVANGLASLRDGQEHAGVGSGERTRTERVKGVHFSLIIN
jgi:hypothetical protein